MLTWAGGLQPTITEEVILRGRFQTLPVAIYGWTLDTYSTEVRGSFIRRALIATARPLKLSRAEFTWGIIIGIMISDRLGGWNHEFCARITLSHRSAMLQVSHGKRG